MIESDHGVRLAATEIGLQVDDGISTIAAEPTRCTSQQLAKPVRQVSASKERNRVLVLTVSIASRDLIEVGRELSLLESTAGNIGMRGDHVTPRRESL